MKPLSVLNYSRNNKKKVIIAITCVCVSVFLLYTFHILFSTLPNTQEFLCFNPLKNASQVMPSKKSKPIGENIIADIENNASVERIIPVNYQYTSFFTLAWDNSSPVYSIKNGDMDYFLKRLNIKLRSGRLPRKGFKEIALDYRVANNKGLKLGDYFGHSVNKIESFPGEYKIVGILSGEASTNIIPYETNLPDDELLKYGMIVFSREGQNKKLDKFLRAVSKDQASIITYSIEKEDIEKYLLKNANEVINLIVILAIAVMSISVGNSIYVHFLERRREFGILSAMGYSYTSIIKKALFEITFMNAIGFAAGILMALLSGYLLKILYLDTLGLTASFWIPTAIIQSLCIPVFTTIFSLVPIYRLIKRIDPINIIEGVN